MALMLLQLELNQELRVLIGLDVGPQMFVNLTLAMNCRKGFVPVFTVFVINFFGGQLAL